MENNLQVIPLYGRGGSGEDPRNKTVPPRPKGQRTEAPQVWLCEL